VCVCVCVCVCVWRAGGVSCVANGRVAWRRRHLQLRVRSIVEGGADDRPMNTLRLSGPFTLMQMHEWVGACLPDLPGRYGERAVALLCQSRVTSPAHLQRHR
jgi:hypothetical protein